MFSNKPNQEVERNICMLCSLRTYLLLSGNLLIVYLKPIDNTLQQKLYKKKIDHVHNLDPLQFYCIYICILCASIKYISGVLIQYGKIAIFQSLITLTKYLLLYCTRRYYNVI